MFKNSPIPLWVNILLVILTLFMAVQVFQFYFDHQSLLDAGITIDGDPDKNIMYTTAARLVAMIGATLFVLFVQKPMMHLVVLLMSVLREGQEMFIDPLFPYANAPGSPAMDFGIHAVIVAAEIAAFVAVYKISKQENSSRRSKPKEAN